MTKTIAILARTWTRIYFLECNGGLTEMRKQMRNEGNKIDNEFGQAIFDFVNYVPQCYDDVHGSGEWGVFLDQQAQEYGFPTKENK